MLTATSLDSVPSPETIREVTREILERAEFAEPARWREILWNIFKAITEWLDGLSAWSAANPLLSRALFIVALILLIACLAHLLYLALADLLPSRQKQSTAQARLSRWDILEGAATDWREALRLARAMLQEGNVRRAVWITHRVLLGLLDEQGAIKFAGWKTNSHYLRECAQSHPWYATFTELTDLYERVVYASRDTPLSVADALLHRVDQLHQATG